MLHLEIRNENSQHNVYAVDHNPNGPIDTFLMHETESWKNIGDLNIEYQLRINQAGKYSIWERVVTLGGEVLFAKNEPLFTKDDNIFGTLIALFNAAPGQQYLSKVSTDVSNGKTEPSLAVDLAEHPFFSKNILLNKTTTTTVKVKELMNHFGLVADGKLGSAASEAEYFFTQRIESNVGLGAIATEATFYLLRNSLLGNKILEEFIGTADLFKLKIMIAREYSVDNPTTDLATPVLLANVTSQIGTNASDIIKGGLFGGVIEGGAGGDRITLESAKTARDILVLKEAHDSQIVDINGDGIITIFDNGIDASFDSVTNFSVGTTDTDDRINVSNFNFSGPQLGFVDAFTRASITTDLTSVPDLFSDPVAGDRGLAFLEDLIDDVSLFTITYLFLDVNKDGDFTAEDDMFVQLVGVDDLTEANFIF